MLDSMGKSKRRSGPRAKHVQPRWRQQTPAKPAGSAERVTHLPAPQVLEHIEHARHVRDEAEAELATLIDYAVDQGIGWPEIAARLGVTRQAARQHYQRRHREDSSHQDRVA
jgi:predicted transcriptional regulator